MAACDAIRIPITLFSQVSATTTEKYLVGKKLSEAAVVQEMVQQLAAEVVPTPDPHQGSVQYRRALVLSLVYKVGAVESSGP